MSLLSLDRQVYKPPSVLTPKIIEHLKRGDITLQDLKAQSSLAWMELSNVLLLHPIRGLIKMTPYPYQRRYLANRSRRKLILKSRQTGISQVVTEDKLHKTIYMPGRQTLFVSRNDDLAKNLLEYARITLQGLDAGEYPEIVTDTTSEITLANKSTLRSVAATKNAGRGFPASDVVMDEVAFMQYAEQIYSSIYPTISTGGDITIISTVNPEGIGGEGYFFYQLWEEALGKSYDHLTASWDENPEYNPDGWFIDDPVRRREIGLQGEWAISTQAGLTRSSWAAEYDMTFDAAGQVMFGYDDIVAMAQDWVGWRDPEFGHKYLNVWDIGRKGDATAGYTFDITNFNQRKSIPAQVVHKEYLVSASYPQIIQTIGDVDDRYKGHTYVESNGIGDAVLELVQLLDNKGIAGYNTSQKSKDQMLDALKIGLEHHLIRCHDSELWAELRRYSRDDKKLVQDRVMALAIGARKLIRPVPSGGWAIGDRTSEDMLDTTRSD